MKIALVFLILTLVCLSGIMFAVQAVHPAITAAAGNGVAVSSHMAALPPQVQQLQLPFTEPVSIVLSSLLLLGATTLLRRNRRAPRAAGQDESAQM